MQDFGHLLPSRVTPQLTQMAFEELMVELL
jgi:hypothetical protein